MRILLLPTLLLVSLPHEALASEGAEARKVAAREAVTSLKKVPEPGFRARLTAVAISEQKLGLPDELVRTLQALGTAGASDCTAMLEPAFFESAPPSFVARCGDTQALKAKVEKARPADRSGLVVKQCKLKAPSGVKLNEVQPWAVALAALVTELLRAQPESNQDELALAGFLNHLGTER